MKCNNWLIAIQTNVGNLINLHVIHLKSTFIIFTKACKYTEFAVSQHMHRSQIR